MNVDIESLLQAARYLTVGLCVHGVLTLAGLLSLALAMREREHNN